MRIGDSWLYGLFFPQNAGQKNMSIDIQLDKGTNKVCCTHQFSILNRFEKAKQLVEAENMRVLS